MTEDQAVRVVAVIEQQTTLIKRQSEALDAAQVEIAALRGEAIAEADDPLTHLLRIVVDGGVRLNDRIEAASLVLQHVVPHSVANVAVAFLTSIASRTDIDARDRIEAAKALAKRQVPRAMTRSVEFVPGEEERRAERLRSLERGKARAALRLTNTLPDELQALIEYRKDERHTVIEYRGEGPDSFHRVEHAPGRRENE